MMLAKDEPSKSTSRIKDDTEQLRAPDDLEGVRDVSPRGSSLDKRKYPEPESPANIKLAAFVPDSKRERISCNYDLDADVSPTTYPKHVLVPTSDHPNIDSRYNPSTETHNMPDDHLHPPHPHHNMGSQGSFSPPELHKGSIRCGSHRAGHHSGAQLLTPDSIGRDRQPSQSYDSHHQPYSSGGRGHHQSSYHDVYRTASYTPEMDYGGGRYPAHGSQGSSGGPATSSGDSFARPRRWACDYCNVATFLSYEEACAHEEQCTMNHHKTPQPYPPHHDRRSRHPSTRPPTAASPYGRPPDSSGLATQPPGQGSGLGALYHASQEVVTPPTPHRHQPSRWGSQAPHGPPLPVFPHEQSAGYYRQGYYDGREDPAIYPPHDHHGSGYHNPPPQHYHPHHQPPPASYHHTHHPAQDPYFNNQQHRLVLAMPSDRDSLSDRQCFVRSEMVEIFAATEKDVSARHSKGAQKLVLGQVGIRCVHCRHLRPRDRAERAVCYPSSISRIYQTVADMQRFHFEQCREIPDHVRQIYKKLKTTRPRGVGSPQTYWVSSAKSMGLADTGDGIRFEHDNSGVDLSGSKEIKTDTSIGSN